MTEQKRTPRTAETRETEERVTEWKPPMARNPVQNTDSHIFRWVRIELDGKTDYSSIEKRQAEGFEIVSPSDPEVAEQVARGLLHVREGQIIRKDTVLCKFSRKLAEQRRRYYTKEAELHQQSVSQALNNERHTSMPMTETITRD